MIIGPQANIIKGKGENVSIIRINFHDCCCYCNGQTFFECLLNFVDVDVEDGRKCVQDDKRRTAHTVAEQKRRDAIKVNNII